MKIKNLTQFSIPLFFDFFIKLWYSNKEWMTIQGQEF